MRKFFKTTEPIYGKSDNLMLECEYRKECGYVATVTPCEHNEGVSMFGVMFSSEYFRHYQSTDSLLVPCGRQNKSKLAEAEQMVEQNPKKYLNQYIETVKTRGGKSIQLIEG